jgi:pyrimidine-specific ribonucleoside hydrolase
MNKKIPIILDGDPGHDDAIAWVMAFAEEKLDVRGVVTVAGNAPLKKTTRNMLQIMTLIGSFADIKGVPLAEGCANPLCGEPFEIPVEVHGESGLDGPVLPEPTAALSELGGVELMAKLLQESEEPITLVPTGPLTNIAGLLLAHPELKPKIAHISLMGGGMLMGNWTPAAEFNILVDPEAAKVVFESGIPITMAGLDVTEKAYVTPEDFERIRALGGNVAEIVAEWLEFFYRFHQKFGYVGAPVHDPVAIVALIKPEILEIKDVYVQIETSGEYCRGATIGDFLGKAGQKPNARVIMNINREAFVDMIVDSIRCYAT